MSEFACVIDQKNYSVAGTIVAQWLKNMGSIPGPAPWVKDLALSCTAV